MKASLLRDTIFENITNSNGQFSNHFHDTYTIGLTHDGMFKSIRAHKASLAYSYSTRIINPGEVHCGDSHAWQYTNFYPSVALLTNLYEQMYGETKIPMFEKHIIQDDELYQRLVFFFRSVYQHEEPLLIESKLIAALSYLITHYTQKSLPSLFTCKDKKSFSMVIDYIHAHLDGDISLDDLSYVAKISKYHFLRLFKNHIGLSPHQYIMAERTYKAKTLILKGESLSLAGLHAGFSDQSHFIRSFRKIYGYSPKTLLQKSNFILYP
ncbi:MAG: AraC family transcriptional regulator [Epsilonproteobacteria bacterium]|nr:AraC family transcriptional regulator [Campylobacterota bacterium]